MGNRVVLAVILSAALGLSCAPKEINYALTVVTKSCDSASDPFAGVNFLRVRVTGDGLDTPPEAVSDAASKSLKLPEIPFGTNRVIEVRGYDADPTQGAAKIISMGRSLPFEVPETVPAELVGKSVPINVVLRKVNTFSPVIAADNPSACVKMKVPRAGHTATVLKNGKVFIAGGYNIMSGTSAQKVALSDTEIFDPNLGTFTAAKDVSFSAASGTFKQPRAFHTATLIPTSGQVVLWGGELYQGVNSVPSPIATTLFYDPDVDDYGALPQRSPPAIPRSHHAVALDSSGKLLIVGGTKMSTGSPVNEVEWLDPGTTQYKIVDGVNLPRLEMSVAAVKKGEYVAVAGGTDGTALVTDVSFFKFIGSTFAKQAVTSNPPHLTDPGRRSAAAAVIHDGQDLMMIGGFGDPTAIKPLASTEIINPVGPTISSGPTVGSRGQTCAVTLLDGSVLTVGGRTADMTGGAARSDGTSQLIKANAQGGVTSSDGPALTNPRYAHTCTTLLDGTVLVTGGINESADGVSVILQDAWIFQPGPTN